MSLLKLRADLLRFAPDVAERFGIRPTDMEALAAEEAALETTDDPKNDPDVDEGA